MVHLRNYSRCRANLLDDFLGALLRPGIDPDRLQRPLRSTVNRSMTHMEYDILRVVNAIDPKAGFALSDDLVNQLPQVTPSPLRVSHEPTRMWLPDTVWTLM